jgi:hypothetical protein
MLSEKLKSNKKMASLVYFFRRCNQVKMKKEQFKSIARIVKKNMADEA